MNIDLIRTMPWSEAHCDDITPLLTREWLVTNGLGGYASGTVSGIVTRQYHGLLVAALPVPLGRVVMLSHMQECVVMGDGSRIGAQRRRAVATVGRMQAGDLDHAR